MNSPIFLDIGNTNAKWRFEGDYYEVPIAEFSFDKLPKTSKIWVSNVSPNLAIKSQSNISFVESQEKYKSLINSYKNPKNLGVDRWLIMIATYELSLGKEFIVVDIGSAVTIDLVDNSGLHLGGVIFPGLFKIRNTFNYFPVEKEIKLKDIGESTKQAWSIGTLGLIVNGINQKIHELKQNMPYAKIYLTGGGYLEIQEFLKFDHSYHENLVIDGLEFYVNNMG